MTNILDKRGYRKRDAYQKSEQAENKFSAYGEQVQKERRTSSQYKENLFKTCRDAHQRKFPCPTEKNSLWQTSTSIFASFCKRVQENGYIPCRILTDSLSQNGKCYRPLKASFMRLKRNCMISWLVNVRRANCRRRRCRHRD